jgi:hypothetical protein
MATTSTGGCVCGAVRYEISADPVMSANCYCRDCQRSTGGAMASVLVVPKSAFRLTKGELKYHTVEGESGKNVSRGFCASCGAPVTTQLGVMPDVMVIKAGSLDEPARFKPTMNIYLSSAQPWAPIAQGLQNFDKMPG